MENRIINGHTRCLLTGAAICKGADEIYYASYAGPAPTCKAIWATIVGCQKKIEISPYDWNKYKEQKGMKSIHTPFLGTSYLNQIVYMPDPGVILVIDSAGARLIDRSNREVGNQRNALLLSHSAYLFAKFTEIINTKTQAVIKPQWAEALWANAERQKEAIIRYHAVGDCLGAFRINILFNWPELVKELLASQVIHF